MTRRPTRLTYVALVFALIGAAVLLRYMDPFFVRALRLIAFDHFQQLDPETYDPKLPIRIVDIDEKSLSMIGQWPWPRTKVRDLLLELASKGAAVVAFDVLMMRSLPPRSRIRQVCCRSYWEREQAPHLKQNRVLPSQAMIRASFYRRSMGPPETFQSSRKQHAGSARSIG